MRPNRLVTISILSGMAGCLLGAVLASRLWLRSSSQWDESHRRTEVILRIRLLHQLRSANHEAAIGEQEALLTGNILDLANTVRSSRRKQAESLDALRSAAAYHRQFPLTSPYPELNQALDQALLPSRK